MTARPVVLLLTRDRRRLVLLEKRLRELELVPVLAEADEVGTGALLRLKPRIAIVDTGHPAAGSQPFLALAVELGVRVVLIGDGVEGAAAEGVFAFGAGVEPVVTDPARDGLGSKIEAALRGL
jgi:hypothetical protein